MHDDSLWMSSVLALSGNPNLEHKSGHTQCQSVQSRDQSEGCGDENAFPMICELTGLLPR